MFAIELSASTFCAREMRGTLSIAMTVAPVAVSCSSSSGFCAGHRKLISVWSARSNEASSPSGALTFMIRSDLDHIDDLATDFAVCVIRET